MAIIWQPRRQSHWEHENEQRAARASGPARNSESRAMMPGRPAEVLREILHDLVGTTAEAEWISGQLERATTTLALAQTAFRAEEAVARLEWVTEETVSLMATL